jgi:hypothetical protein
MRHVRPLLWLAIGAVTGCASFHAVPPSTPAGLDLDAVKAHVRSGDMVRVLRKDATESKFTVTAIDADALVSRAGERVPYADIARLERRSFSATKTVFLVLSPAIVMGGLLLILQFINPEL